MPIISKVGKKAAKAKALVLVIYVLLSLGAITMVYPFVLMIAGSTKSTVDQKELRVIPGFLADDVLLYRKHMEAMFNERLDYMKIAYDTDIPTFEKISPLGYVGQDQIDKLKKQIEDIEKLETLVAALSPSSDEKWRTRLTSQLEAAKHSKSIVIDEIAYSNPKYAQAIREGKTELVPQPATPNRQLVQEWKTFLDENQLPVYSYDLGHLAVYSTRGTRPIMLRAYAGELHEDFDGDIAKVNEALNSYFVDWTSVIARVSPHMIRREKLLKSPIASRMTEFRERQPEWFRYYTSVEGVYKTLFIKTQYTRNIETYNEKHETNFASYDELYLPRRYPTDAPPPVREEWEKFVRADLNLLWIKPDAEAVTDYRTFLKAKYLKINSLNSLYGTEYQSFEEVPLVSDPPQGIVLSDWDAFIQGWKDPTTNTMHQMSVGHLRIDCLDFQWQDHLLAKYDSVEQINQTFGTRYASLADIPMPQQDAHYIDFLDNAGELKWEFIGRNYRMVVDYMALQGRALWNTVIYCSLAILSALIVNPMAAYAMSRFRLPTTYTILLFLMLTMAFPPMVTQIPVFLMLRNLGLLNTFAALILPGLANGYAIFILKGFFDSQPRELYESASLDGANEWIIFWQICMNLSKPVLAYIALQAFTHAYANFLFALLICQDREMWTLMPMLYQLQQRSHEGITFASLIIAAIPTFLVFLFAQNIIMRGIVVPVEK